MIHRTLTALAFAGACTALIAGAPAQAQTWDKAGNESVVATSPRVDPGDEAGYAAGRANVRESRQYEALIRSNPSFRAQRIQKECGPITDPQLHADCLASFGEVGSGSSLPR